MVLAAFETALHWTAAVAGLAAVACALLGAWRQQRRPHGRTTGAGVRLLRWPAMVAFTVLYVALCVWLWKPLPVRLAPAGRLAADLLGALFLFPGVALYLWGMRTLGPMFAASNSLGVQLYADQRLITGGPFAYVRHPMYLAVIMAGIGALLIYRTWAMLFFAANMFALPLRARREERALAAEFGDEWAAYARRVPRWLPRLRRSATEK